MYQIYGPKQSSSFRCLWVAEELGVPYENIPVDMKEKGHKSPEFLAMNPNGKVPVLKNGDFVVWESLAICNYMVDKEGSDLAGANAEERALVWQWTLWALIHLAQPLEKVMSYKWMNKPEDAEAEEARGRLPQWFTILNAALEGKEYLVADRFTLADLSVVSVANYTNYIGYDLSAYPNVVAWIQRINQREALKKLMA